ncbi:MAG: glutamate--tRNA ligase [Candidatus Diapherotrites archaeon]
MEQVMKDLAYKYAVKNAFEHEFKADLKAVIGKLIALDKDFSKNLSKEIKEVNEIVEKVNSMKREGIEREYKRFEGSYELKPQEQREGLKELDWAQEGKIVTRFAPNPNAPFHIGNARAAYMSYAYTKKYGGKFILRFDDTDPKVKKSIENAEQIFLEDLEWLGIKTDTTYFASDRLEIYFRYMRKLVLMGKAYVCTCQKEEWKKCIDAKKWCPCRELPEEVQLERYDKMQKHEYKEGKAVLRLKTDLNSDDPSVRDWWMAKIVDEPEHPRIKVPVHVWPSYNFASAIDDHELNVTYIIRGQEHAQNAVKQKFLYDYLGWVYPHVSLIGRIKLEGVILSKSAINKGIEEGLYQGYDDPRLGTIRALRRRGFRAEVIIEALEDIGIKSSDATISMKALIAMNKKLIDREAERFTFINDPIKFDVQFVPKMKVEKVIHPDFPERGARAYELNEGTQTFYVPKKELEGIKEGQVVRLRHAVNAKIVELSEERVFAEFVGTGKLENNPIISWVLEEVGASVLMPDAEKLYGIIDYEASLKETGSYVQLEKFGYAIIDSKDMHQLNLWFCHE